MKYKEKNTILSQRGKTLQTIILPPVGPGHVKSAEASLPSHG